MIQMPSSPRHYTTQSVKHAACEPHDTELIATTNWGLHCYLRRRKSLPDQLHCDSFAEYSRWKRGALDIAAETSQIARSVLVTTPLEDWRRGDCPSADRPVQQKAIRIAQAKTTVIAETMEESLAKAVTPAGSQRTLHRAPCGPKTQLPTSGFAEYDHWKRDNLDIEAETAPLGRSEPGTNPLESWRSKHSVSDVADDDATEPSITTDASTISGFEGGTKKCSKGKARGFPEYDRWRRGALDIDAETAPLGRSEPVATPLEAWRTPCSTFDTGQYHQAPIEAVA